MGRIFPFQFIILGVVIIFAGLVLLVENWWAAGLIVLGLFILTAYNGTEIDLKEKIFREYNSFFYYKSGEKETFNSIDQIYITTSRVSQEIYTKITTTSTIRSVVYNVYIVFNGDHKVHLVSKKNKDKALKSIEVLLKETGLKLSDYCTPSN